MSALHHVDLVVRSLATSLPFYRELLDPLGWTSHSEVEGERGETIHYLGPPGGGQLGLREAQSTAHATPYDRYAVGVHHVCFAAASRARVDERHDWLVARGAEIESPPQEYGYTAGYYAVFFHDPDGLKLEIVHEPS